MPVVATTRYGTAGDVLDYARALMNDPNGVLWSDAVLFPFLNGEYRALQTELAVNGVSVMEKSTTIDLPLTTAAYTAPGQTTPQTIALAPNPPLIADDTNPQLPTDLIVPYRLREAATNSSDYFIPMERITGDFPNWTPQQYLRIWKWESDQIKLLGATQAITIAVAYECALGELSADTDPIMIPHANKPLAFGVASVAARSRGAQALAMDMQQAQQIQIAKIVERYTRASQFKVRRRRPYGSRRGPIYL